jgi:hypothetical protein
MTASHNPHCHPLGPSPVGARVRVHRADGSHPGRINAVHHRGATIEYVIHLDDSDGGLGQVVNVRATDGGAIALASAVNPDGDLR